MKLTIALVAFTASLFGCVEGQVDFPIAPNVIPIDYDDNGFVLQGFMAMPEGDGPFPTVVILPDANGVNEYEQVRATMVAQEWGFAAFAADIYGPEYTMVDNSTLRTELLTMYRGDMELFLGRIEAALSHVASLPEVDSSNIAVMGYCFGGTGVINYALSGMSTAKAVVSFHGGLVYPENGTVAEAHMLVLSGGDDDASSEIMDLEKRLDAANATWEITRYAGIEHAWTVFTDERYNAEADAQSWWTAGHFLQEQFGVFEFESSPPDKFDVTPVEYMEGNTTLRGYLALPDTMWTRPLPAVVVLPDWSGVDDYEKQRVQLLADKGYVAFAADIYGADLQVELDFPQRVELVTGFYMDIPKYIRRIQAAVDQVKANMEVDAGEIAIIGYCFGGSGAVLYSFNGAEDVKVAVGFHGSYDLLPPPSATISPYLLILSGGADDLHGNQTKMEGYFNEGMAEWGITRYAGVGHGFTAWGGQDYNVLADVRSWESMWNVLSEKMALPMMEGDMGETPDMPSSNTSATESPAMSPVAASPASTVAASPASTIMPSVAILALMFAALFL